MADLDDPHDRRPETGLVDVASHGCIRGTPDALWNPARHGLQGRSTWMNHALSVMM
jgi:hypothetical protein